MENNEQIQNRLRKLEENKENGIHSFANIFKPNTSAEEINQKYVNTTKEEFVKNEVVVKAAGRLMAKRGQGKAGFANIKDNIEEIQFYVAKDNVSEEDFKLWKVIDIGDIVYGEGEIFRTRTEQLAIRIRKFKLVTKSLRPLPEKFHGLVDIEKIYRQRYLDLIVNDESKDRFIKRSEIILGIRNYLNNQGYIEAETPILQTIAGGAAAKPFITESNALHIEMYLRIATELHLKRLLVGGFPKVYEIGRIFRNEGISIKHNPEFTTVEVYQAFGDMEQMMNLTEDMIRTLAKNILKTEKIMYEDLEIDLSNFNRKHVVDLIKEETGINFFEVTDETEARKYAKEFNIELDTHHHTTGHIINEFFEQLCEEKLIQPIFVYGHPIEVSPLARKNEENSRFTDRFELFIGGREYANAFSELNDPIDQNQRFDAQLKEIDLGNEEATYKDEDYIEALSYGMPPAGGLGMGIDRLVMLFTNASSIRDVILFPTQKPLED